MFFQKSRKLMPVIAVAAVLCFGTSAFGMADNHLFKDSQYLLPQSSTKVISASDVRMFGVRQLEIARNEIYARKGYIFKTEYMKSYFKEQPWYRPDPSFTEGRLSAREKANAAFLRNQQTILEKHSPGKEMKNISIDLNGDGKKDQISFKHDQDNHYTLTVNGISVTGQGENLHNGVSILDINTKDKYKEIAVSEDGPSDDYYTYFYGYDGKTLRRLGEAGASEFDLIGNGTMTSDLRGNVLHTWFHREMYQLTGNRKIVEVPQKFYDMGREVVTMKKQIDLYSDPSVSKLIHTLLVGERARLLQTDDKKWVKVVTEAGVVGWFDESKLRPYAGDYMDGLCFAD